MAKAKPSEPTADGTQIFKATYSGVPVYEMICKTVAVMRRRSDSWLNATQILKVAGFDKPQRTRVLEREVQKGTHEKIQGGYGKYQGTWVPIERGLALSKQYNVEDLMRPIIDYIPTAESPPQAPKHITAVPVRNKKVAKGDTPAQASTATTADGEAGPSTPALSSRQISRAANLAAQAQAKATAAKELAAERKEKRERDKEDKRLAAEAAARDASFEGDDTFSGDEDSLNGSLSAGSSNSRTPSPVGGSEDEDYEAGQGDSTTSKRKRKFKDGYEPSTQRQRLETNPNNRVLQNAHQPDNSYHHSHPSHPHHPDDNVYIPPPEEFVGPERYEDTILDYFISESSQIPSILINPPLDFDPNVPIDDDGHTALHWACAMGRIRVVKLLLTAGADIYRVNQSEQTALMRSVMFSNNYDVRKFPELYELLHRSTLNIDKQNRTVFHHISDVALSKGKTHAARYYMETILGRLADYPKELGDVINFQDDDGETALTLAARARSKRLVKSLLDHGADPKLANRDGKTAQDYILEDERFRASPQVGTTGLLPSNANGNNGALTNTNYINHNNPLNPASFHNASSSSSSANPNGLFSSSSQQPPLPSPIPRIYHSSTAQLAAGRTTTELTHLLASLAQSFDAELQGKERDLVQTNSLVSHIQKEILETRRMAEAMKVKLGNQLEEGVRELGRLEGELERELEERYKGGWREWRKAQQEGEGELVKKVEGGETDGVEGEGESEAKEGELEALRVKVLVGGRKKRREMFKKYLELERERGTADELVKSRMIVKDAARLDGDGEGDVDDILEALLEALESEQTQTASDSSSALKPNPKPPSSSSNPRPPPHPQPSSSSSSSFSYRPHAQSSQMPPHPSYPQPYPPQQHQQHQQHQPYPSYPPPPPHQQQQQFFAPSSFQQTQAHYSAGPSS